MNIDLELYKVFYIVAKNKHMTKASEELHISQPAISQSIKKLEDQLGGTLFLRSNKGMELTEEGKMFYEYVKGALELINDAENEFTSFKDLTKGEIKIGCSTTLTKLILMNALKEFHKEYPNININITNNLTSNLLSIGQVLKIPQGKTSTENIYTVKKGDSLWTIANRYNTTVEKIKVLNNLTSNLLSVGQQLKIPN